MGWMRVLALVVALVGAGAVPAAGSQPARPEVLDSGGWLGVFQGSTQRQLRVYSRRIETWPPELEGTSRRVREILTRYTPATRRLEHVIRVEERYLERGPREYYGAEVGGTEDGAGRVVALSAHQLEMGDCPQACGLARYAEVYEVPVPAEVLRLAPGAEYCVRFLARRGDPMLGGVLQWCVTGRQVAAHLRAVEGEARFHRVALPAGALPQGAGGK